MRVRSFTAKPHSIADYGVLQDERGERRFELALVGESRGTLIARIPGIEDRDAAEALKGTRLYVRRVDLPEPEAEEFYEADLMGLEAVMADGTRLGTVCAVHDFGAGASLEIEDAARKTVMVPFTAAAVPMVDIAGGRVVIERSEGLAEPSAQAKVE